MASAFNASNIPVEAQEQRHPVVVERFELIPDSAGPGRNRGGLGIRRDMRFLAEAGTFTNLSERQRFPPYGLFGGGPGRLGRTVINPGPGERAVHGKEAVDFAYGDVISFQQSGAGGYGDALSRDPARVLEDVREGYVSIDHAARAYGVVVDPVAMAVDAEATGRRRAAMAGGAA